MVHYEKTKPLWHYAIIPLLAALCLILLFAADRAFDLNLYRFGLWPGDYDQWYGVFTFGFLHGSVKHLINNVMGLVVLLTLLRYFFPVVFFRMLLISFFLPGILTFFIGRPSYHIGASGAVYALAAFLFVSSLLRFNRYLLALSMLVIFLYGGLWWGMLPIDDQMSWEGHLSGAIVGILAALLYINKPINPDVIEHKIEDDADEGPDRVGDAWRESEIREIRYVYRDDKDSSS